MEVIGRGPSARALERGGRDIRGVVNWSGTPQTVWSVNQNTETHKLKQLQRLKASEVPTVPFSTTPLATDTPWFGRTNYHQQGNDFRRRITPDFWTQPLESIGEYRIHVFRKPRTQAGNPASFKVVRAGWKVYNPDDSSLPQPGAYPIRSRKFGWKLNYWGDPDNCSFKRDMYLYSRWAIAALGWDFGCVDMLRLTDRTFRVLECNSCPGLRDERTLEAYMQGIEALLEE